MFRSVFASALVLVAANYALSQAPANYSQVVRPFSAVPPPVPHYLQPVIQYRPMVYDHTTEEEKRYATPLRSLLFGSSVLRHHYVPGTYGFGTPVIRVPLVPQHPAASQNHPPLPSGLPTPAAKPQEPEVRVDPETTKRIVIELVE